MFSHWGYPDEIACDGGSQFTSASFEAFTREHNVKVTYSSPPFPQANSAGESDVKIAKSVLRQKDIFSALRAYRCTPTSTTGFSPSELMIGRNIRRHVLCLPVRTIETKMAYV